jgi:hypothetical protein
LSSIFDTNSSACHLALGALSVILKQVGFVVDKKRESESTLRVYVQARLTYPLLNPRFQRTSTRGRADHGILEITALSTGDETLESRLCAFPASEEAIFKSVRLRQGKYFNHGYFAVPLVFRDGSRFAALDFAALGGPLTAILRHLE